MKCFTFKNEEIKDFIYNYWNNSCNQEEITNASIRFYACESNGMLIAEAAGNRLKDMFLYGYTELIPETGAGTLFPEGSYLLDLKTSDYIPKDSDKCMVVQTWQDRTLLGCLKESVVNTPYGCITCENEKPTLSEIMPVANELKTFDNVIVLEA